MAPAHSQYRGTVHPAVPEASTGLTGHHSDAASSWTGGLDVSNVAAHKAGFGKVHGTFLPHVRREQSTVPHPVPRLVAVVAEIGICCGSAKPRSKVGGTLSSSRAPWLKIVLSVVVLSVTHYSLARNLSKDKQAISFCVSVTA